MSMDGVHVSSIAGSGKKGYKDGPAGSAMFDSPSGVCVCPADGALIVADTGNNALRRVLNGVVSTIAGGPVDVQPQV